MLSTSFANDVRQTLDQFRRSVDQMFDNSFGYQTQPHTSAGPASDERQWTFSPLLESAWTKDYLHLRAILPGVAENDIRVSVQNNQLVLEGERKAPEGFDKRAFTALAYGRFYAVWTLPSGLDLDNVNCRLEHGILEIQVPILEASKPRQIQIHSGGSTNPQQRSITA